MGVTIFFIIFYSFIAGVLWFIGYKIYKINNGIPRIMPLSPRKPVVVGPELERRQIINRGAFGLSANMQNLIIYAFFGLFVTGVIIGSIPLVSDWFKQNESTVGIALVLFIWLWKTSIIQILFFGGFIMYSVYCIFIQPIIQRLAQINEKLDKLISQHRRH